MGHALGLKHSSVADSVMRTDYGGYSAKYALGEDDIAGIQHLYGKPGNCES